VVIIAKAFHKGIRLYTVSHVMVRNGSILAGTKTLFMFREAKKSFEVPKTILECS